ncbi:PD-(D/E)XK nuclease family protein [Sphaerospermopsis aphanizomenoides BCCUSP55]|uniref:PD-(D/E)XK nuclease family protein n=1 Tax=Sphaerospermopsis aphanizomenoides TaxID=459663 RepID=UPI00190353E7|nr:PD-(D/E)XK nuclease family protein [Sphaerospermopsis aphanizomenoides]MBK1990297.1 PD-(D/E)XK nuclease family protein [Sphaerospermopsis aphanizomenoides BCCUSP55]
MLSTSTQLFRLSQGHLSLLAACPRKFQHTYLEQLITPSDPQQTENQTLGSRFHLLMQQQEMGLPINSFLQTDAQLQKWMTSLAQNAPEILSPDTNIHTFRESEHYRTLQIQDYVLTVIYDLLIADNEKAQIFDWKTYPQPPKRSTLAKNWQTRLYMYVMAETSTYSLENISMTYWFVQAKGKTKNIQFSYDTKQHAHIGNQLNQLLNKLTNWLDNYQNGQPFPQVGESKTCDCCQFAKRCDRFSNGRYSSNSLEAAVTNYIPNLDIIEEVSL